VEWAKDVIEGQINHLSRLIEDLLDVSRITRGKIQLRRQRIDLNSVVRQAVGVVGSMVAERQHRLKVITPPDQLMIDADPTRVEQILVNLLGNAAKYTEPGGQIKMTVERIGSENVVTIHDNGIGIAAEQLPRMFELFVQGDRSIARSEGGLGIGLTLVKRLVESHGGRIEATSPGLGQGSTFRVAFPDSTATPATSVAESPQDRPVAKPCSKILVVDDNVATARGMAKLLGLLGHEVRMAYDGHEAIDIAQEFCPQTILLDIGLPGMDGYQVAARLRKEASCRDSKIIAVSGYGQDEDRRRSLAAGFNHHLVKPVNPDVLMTLLSGD
jgi:CheY-like chemotaxis protein